MSENAVYEFVVGEAGGQYAPVGSYWATFAGVELRPGDTAKATRDCYRFDWKVADDASPHNGKLASVCGTP